MVPDELKKSMVQELSRKYLDDLFKMQFLQWKFDVQRAAERMRVADTPTDALEEEE
ncbi:cytochrome P450 CYP736A12-like [Pyrus ussuriensis x Pyrus communis]|uniref:Cytochrome P450 CYP736A12-like n=1 Tax=Pyrus ussuriensis x Pyrus communis TaxID=2448454 RepID=A0A5N5GN28_9ROSA|nr:cytochrome P450 CYP736A12-like [Pyrus ussuriensis x Pyrus communis]